MERPSRKTLIIIILILTLIIIITIIIIIIIVIVVVVVKLVSAEDRSVIRHTHSLCVYMHVFPVPCDVSL